MWKLTFKIQKREHTCVCCDSLVSLLVLLHSTLFALAASWSAAGREATHSQQELYPVG